ncbi:MAG: outer membrane lipoprotein carrier protein LolA [Deltaproteobacteria bacterium]|nr:MAG: outer membrane lipoprotein carrier protein LolA [Deltaproteobacteria bacterium]
MIPLLLLLIGPIPLRKALPDDKLSTVIGGLRGRYGNAKGLTAKYTREAISKTMAMLEVADRHDLAKGRLYFSPPHFLRLEQASPQEELLLTDEHTLWWYLPLKNEAYKYPAEKFGRELRLLSDILKGLKDTEDSFNITLNAMPEANTYHLILKPEPPWQDIDHLEVIILKGDFAIKQMDIYNNIGGLTRFLLTDWEEKHRFSPGFFSFSPPPGIKVIEE